MESKAEKVSLIQIQHGKYMSRQIHEMEKVLKLLFSGEDFPWYQNRNFYYSTFLSQGALTKVSYHDFMETSIKHPLSCGDYG